MELFLANFKNNDWCDLELIVEFNADGEILHCTDLGVSFSTHKYVLVLGRNPKAIPDGVSFSFPQKINKRKPVGNEIETKNIRDLQFLAKREFVRHYGNLVQMDLFETY